MDTRKTLTLTGKSFESQVNQIGAVEYMTNSRLHHILAGESSREAHPHDLHPSLALPRSLARSLSIVRLEALSRCSVSVRRALAFLEKLRQLPVHSRSSSGTMRMGLVDDRKSYIMENMIHLRDWYLIKSPTAHMGKRLAIGGILSKGDQDVGIFQSAPIVERLNAFRLRTADGVIIILFGLIDRQRTSENGFPSEVLSLFQTGFPFTWEILTDTYISSNDTSCCSLGHDNNADELMHSTGRARRVRIFSDDDKWSKNDSAGGPECHRSMKSSFARKIEGNIQEFDDADGKMHPDHGDRCVKNCVDEAIMKQTLLDTVKIISYKDKGIQPHHVFEHVNSDMEQSAADKPSPMKGTGNFYSVASVSVGQSVEMTPNTHEVGYAANTGFDKDCNNLLKSPECSNDMLSANIPVEKLDGGDGNVVKDPEIQNVSCSEIMYLSESQIVMPLATPFKCTLATSVSSPVVLIHKRVPRQPGKNTPVDAESGAFMENSVGERIRDTAKLVIGGCTTSSNSKSVKHEHVESENDSLLRSPVKRTKTCQLGLSKELSQRGAHMKSEAIKVTGKDASSVAPFTHRVTRSRARSSSFEVLEKREYNDSYGLKDDFNKDTVIPMDCPKDDLVGMDDSTSGAFEFGIEENKDKMRLDAETKDSGHGITRLKAMSSRLRRSQKEGKQGCSTQKVSNGEDVTVSTNCFKDTVLNMYSRRSHFIGTETGKNKYKLGLDAKSFDSGHRTTRSRAMSSSLRSPRKEREGDCHTQKNSSNMNVTVSESCSKGGVCDNRHGETEIGVGEIKNKEILDAKILDSDELLNLTNKIGHGTEKCKLQYGPSTDLHTQHAGKHLLSAVGCDQVEGLVRQRSEASDDLQESKHSCSKTVATGKKKKRKRNVQHACRLFVPSGSAEKSSSAPGRALNLKMSSSGRLIVPPLAHWRNEQIVYDTEGKIACVFDGSQVVKRPGNMLTRRRKPQRL
ncbi:uncharacterized protein LOC116255209 [Nymphaea colorata]|nr:uncharacterized protein LOC116255209 [Nymphaea colorata]